MEYPFLIWKIEKKKKKPSLLFSNYFVTQKILYLFAIPRHSPDWLKIKKEGGLSQGHFLLN